MNFDRRALLRALGAGSIGTAAAGLGAGSAAAATVITMEGGGEDIWSTADAFHYYYQRVSGDFDVVVQNPFIEGLESFTKCGPMVRASLDPAAANAMVRRRPNGEASMQYRPESGAETESAGGTPADWLRLVRTGDTVETYHSTEEGNWTLIERLGADDITLGDEAYVGLAVTSHVVGELATATFQNLSGLSPTSNRDIGDVEVAGSVSVEEGVPLVSTGEATNVGTGSATVSGELADLGGADSADCYFEYREVPTESWTATEARTLTSTGSFEAEVGDLTDRRYYEVRAVADTSDGDSATGAPVVFATAARAGGGGGDGTLGGASDIGPSDGFADAAPWLDDGTPIIKVREPTRSQLERALNVDGERLVVFETSGTIDLGAEVLEIPNDKCYVAGQTAPSPGVTLVRGGLYVNASDCVVQHLRVRAGTAGQGEDWEPDAMHTGDDTINNVVDHCTATWGVDENLSVGYRTDATTFTNCLIAEGLGDATHHKGAHSNGTLVGDGAENVALLGNLWANNVERNPLMKYDTRNVVANNVAAYFDQLLMLKTTYASIVGNLYLNPRFPSEPTIGRDGYAYLEDNYTAGTGPLAADDITRLDEPPLWPEGFEALPSGDVREYVLSNAGARPADRTRHDERVVEQVRTGEGEYIDSQEEVGGYPDLEVNSRRLNVPKGGVRAWLGSHSVRVERPDVDHF